MKASALCVLFLAPSIGLGQNTISTIAGSGTCCADPDGVPATNAYLQGLYGLVFDSQGNLYMWESQPSRIRKVTPAGIISTVAGVDKNPGYSGDGGPATSAQLLASTQHSGLAWDSRGNLYISDGGNQRIRKVSPGGVITTVAGTGADGFSGDGGAATGAMLSSPSGIAVDSLDNLYIADYGNRRVRKVTPDGKISTVAGNGNAVSGGDGGPATGAAFQQPRAVAVDGAGNLYISEGSKIRKVNSLGVISTVAGTGTQGFSGDGGPATNARLAAATGMVIDSGGNLYFADTSNQRVRRVDAAGVITTIAGSTAGFAGDGGPAANAQLRVPHDVALDAAGNLYVTDTGNFRVRKITISGPRLTANPAQLTFSYATGGDNPAAQTVTLTSSVTGENVTAAVSTGGDWLSVEPASGASPLRLKVSANGAGKARGAYSGSVTVTGAGGATLVFAAALNVTGADAPVITGVVNNSGFQSILAPGVLFRMSGVGLGGAVEARAEPPGYPATLSGSSVRLVSRDTAAGVDALLVSASEGKIIALLPSTTAPGSYEVRATYNGLTGAPWSATVAAGSLGIDTLAGTGNGQAKASLETVNGGASQIRFTTGSGTAADGQELVLTPAHAGDTVVLTGTGGGEDSANDGGDTAGDQSGSGRYAVLVGAREIAPVFAGTLAGSPGVWVVKFALPVDIETGCFVPVQTRVGNEKGNQATIAIAGEGQSECSDAALSQDTLRVLDAGGVITIGGFGIAKASQTTTILSAPGGTATTIRGDQENIGGGIGRYTAAQYAALMSRQRFGLCTVKDTTTVATEKPPHAPESYIDAGPSIPASGPGLVAGAALQVAGAGPVYSLLLPNGSLQGGGQYSLSGKGGPDLGQFEVKVTFPMRFVATNLDAIAAIDRTEPLMVTWEGEGFNRVDIVIGTSRVLGKTAAGVNIVRNVALTCEVPAEGGSFTVPVEALAYLLPEDIDAASMARGAGLLSVGGANQQVFTAPLTAGGQVDYTALSAVLGASRNLVVK